MPERGGIPSQRRGSSIAVARLEARDCRLRGSHESCELRLRQSALHTDRGQSTNQLASLKRGIDQLSETLVGCIALLDQFCEEVAHGLLFVIGLGSDHIVIDITHLV